MNDVLLYHREIGFPAGSIAPLCNTAFDLRYTRHAMLEAMHDKLGVVYHPPLCVYVDSQNVVELEQFRGVTTKVVVRIPYKERVPTYPARDLILVLRPSDAGMIVITLWTNECTDIHGTLDKTKYTTP